MPGASTAPTYGTESTPAGSTSSGHPLASNPPHATAPVESRTSIAKPRSAPEYATHASRIPPVDAEGMATTGASAAGVHGARGWTDATRGIGAASVPEPPAIATAGSGASGRIGSGAATIPSRPTPTSIANVPSGGDEIEHVVAGGA